MPNVIPGGSPSNPMGTDSLGHDLFAQVQRGMQQSLFEGVMLPHHEHLQRLLEKLIP